MNTIIFHIDVNSAFLSWTAVKKLKNGDSIDLRDIPSIIGGDIKNRHGIVVAKSIPAKAFGIHTAEPVVSAMRKCPNLVIEKPDMEYYRHMSQELMTLLKGFTSDIEQLSIDECFLDFGPVSDQFSSAEAAAHQIKDTIRERFGYTVNIGISSNKVLAKMASDFQKPDRVHTLFPDEIQEKMWPLSVDELYMVGKSSASRLKSLGIRTIGELAQTDLSFLQSVFKSHGKLMWKYANGIGDCTIHPEARIAKGIGNSTTLHKDVANAEDAKPVLLMLSESVGERLRKNRQLAGTITVELKYSDFTSCSHQTSLFTPSNRTNILYETACELFHALWDGRPIRLIGLRGTKLMDEDAPLQMSIFDFPAANPEDNSLY